jgi:hypothetical protein
MGRIIMGAGGQTRHGGAPWDPTVPAVPTSYMRRGDYAVTAGPRGDWAPIVGFGATSVGAGAGVPAADPAGVAHRVAATNDGLNSIASDMTALVGLSSAVGFTIALCVDVLSMPGPFSNLVSDHEFFLALYLDKAAGKAVIAYYQTPANAYQLAQVTVPQTGRIALVAVRDVSGPSPVIRLTADGATYSADLVVTDLKAQTFAGVSLGYNASPGVHYPLDARYQAFVAAKSCWSPANIASFFPWAAAL